MEVHFDRKFLKDLVKIPFKDRIKIEQFVFEDCDKLDSFWSLKSAEKLKGYTNFYRIKLGNYRIGIKYESNVVIFERVLHRKDIYRYFP